jgi:hypothetical protein
MGTLLRGIENHIRSQGITPARFGREAVNDPCLVRELRCGRVLRPATLARVEAYLAAAKRSIVNES